MAEPARQAKTPSSSKTELRQLRLRVPDARLPSVRRRVARAVEGMDHSNEAATLAWIEAVSEFDETAQ